jgi:hypothetical protein
VPKHPCSAALGGLAAVGLVVGTGCTTPDGRPPIARISLVPDAILENDNFQTTVTLDASRSGDSVDDPGGTQPLSYAWTIIGDDYRLETGNEGSAAAVLRFRGARPPTIELVVTDVDGLDALAVARLRLTVR